MTTRSPNNLIDTLLEQHELIRDLLREVETTAGPVRRRAFDALRELLAVHETGEEAVLRPVSRDAAGEGVADARNREEDQAAGALAELEQLDVDSPGFGAQFARFAQGVRAHTEREEREEFPAVRAARSPDELHDLGNKLLAGERRAPARASHAATQQVTGPFAALRDDARTAFSG